MTPDEDVDAIIAKKLKVAISIVFPMFIAKPSKRDFFSPILNGAYININAALCDHAMVLKKYAVQVTLVRTDISTDRHKYGQTNRVKEMLIRGPKKNSFVFLDSRDIFCFFFTSFCD